MTKTSALLAVCVALLVPSAGAQGPTSAGGGRLSPAMNGGRTQSAAAQALKQRLSHSPFAEKSALRRMGKYERKRYLQHSTLSGHAGEAPTLQEHATPTNPTTSTFTHIAGTLLLRDREMRMGAAAEKGTAGLERLGKPQSELPMQSAFDAFQAQQLALNKLTRTEIESQVALAQARLIRHNMAGRSQANAGVIGLALGVAGVPPFDALAGANPAGSVGIGGVQAGYPSNASAGPPAAHGKNTGARHNGGAFQVSPAGGSASAAPLSGLEIFGLGFGANGTSIGTAQQSALDATPVGLGSIGAPGINSWGATKLVGFGDVGANRFIATNLVGGRKHAPDSNRVRLAKSRALIHQAVGEDKTKLDNANAGGAGGVGAAGSAGGPGNGSGTGGHG